RHPLSSPLFPYTTLFRSKPHRRRPGSIAITELEEAFPDDRADHTLGRRLDHPDRARLAVGHVEPHAVRGESARLVHRRLLPRSVLERFAPGARMGADAIASAHHRPELMRPGHGDVNDAVRDRQIPR